MWWTKSTSQAQQSRSASLNVERLETREVLDAQPLATLASSGEQLIGSTFSLQLEFDNVGDQIGYGPFVNLYIDATGNDGVGDPNTGAPTETFDGLDFVSASLLGTPVTVDVLTLTDNGVAHPRLRDASGNPVLIYPGTAPSGGISAPPGFVAGDLLVVLQLPYGSFTPTQPTQTFTIQLELSQLADANVPISVVAQGGFEFGQDALANPDVDPPLLQTTTSEVDITPTVYTLRKEYLGPEGETATGVNYPRSYRVIVDVAEGQTLEDLVITDILPDEIFYLDATGFGGSGVADPVLGVSVLSEPSRNFLGDGPTGGVLEVQFAEVQGTFGPLDAFFTIEFFVPEFSAPDGSGFIIDRETGFRRDTTLGPVSSTGTGHVLNPITGNPQSVVNDVTGSAVWEPLDPRDTATTVDVTEPVPDNIFTARSLATQKDVQILNDTGEPGLTPGDILQYTIDIQISDYFAFQNLSVLDILSDGQRLLDGTNGRALYIPRLTVVSDGGAIIGTIPLGAEFSLSNITANINSDGRANDDPLNVPGTDGSTEITFDVGQEMMDRLGYSALLGGLVQDGDGIQNDGPTTIRIVYRTVVLDAYTDDYSSSADASLDEGDGVSNTVEVTGELIDADTGNAADPNSGLPADQFGPDEVIGTGESDTSSSSSTIDSGNLAKTIYAVNGVANPGSYPNGTLVAPTDTVTYRLTRTILSGDFENLVLTDFLPLPIFDALELSGATTYQDLVGLGIDAPTAGNFALAPSDTFFARSGVVPTISVDAASNSISFDFGSYENTLNDLLVIDLLFTVTVSSDPFADALLLTNQVQSTSTNTNGDVISKSSIIQVTLAEPDVVSINSRKGIVSTSSPNAIFDKPVGPVAFDGPGDSLNGGFSGVINSTNLAATPIDANVSNLDAGDLVRFALVLENVGASRFGVFDITFRDLLPPNFLMPTTAGELNLKIYDGAGDEIQLDPAYTLNPLDLFSATGLRLLDPGPTAPEFDGTNGGAIDAYDPLSGRNILVVLFDLRVADDVSATTPTSVNTAILEDYGNLEGQVQAGLGFLPGDEFLSDTATASFRGTTATKSIVATSEAHTSDVESGVNNANARPVAIGEIVRYRLVIDLPEGVDPNVQIEDLLPSGLLFLNDGTATVYAVSNGGAGGLFSSTLALPNATGNESFDFNNPGVTPLVLPGSAISGSPFASGSNVRFLLGDITNADRDSDREFLVIEFNAIVDNFPSGNDAGEFLSNAFRVIVNDTLAGANSNVAVVRIVEPNLTLAKTSDVDIVDTGDFVTFTLTVSNATGTNAATAFDVQVTDVLPAGLTLAAGQSSITSSNGTVVGASLVDSGNGILLTISELGVGGSVTFTIVATVDAGITQGQVITNTGDVTYTSLPGTGTPNGQPGNATGSTTPGVSGATTGERDGSGGPTGNPNDYATSASDSITAFRPVIDSKTIVATSEAHTIGTDVTIGEIIRYRLVIELPEVTVADFRVQDILPEGLMFLNDGTATLAFVANDGGISSTTLGTTPDVNGNEGTLAGIVPSYVIPLSAIYGESGSPLAGLTGASGEDVVFRLGDLVNNDTDADREYIVIEFNALADNSAVASTTQATNNSGDVRSNTFTISTGTTQIGDPSAAVDVAIVEPELSLTKDVIVSGPGDSGDTVTYTLNITHSSASTADAQDLLLTDLLPSEMDLQTVVVSGGVGVNVNAVGNNITITVDQLALNDSLTITITATLNTTTVVNTTITNTANLTYTSLPGSGTIGNPTGSETPGTAGSETGERDGGGGINDYVATDSVSFDTPLPTLNKSVDRSFATIGQTVVYDVSLTLPEGTTQNVVLTDVLPPEIAIVSIDDILINGVSYSAGPGVISTDVAGGFAGVLLNARGNLTAPGQQFEVDLGTLINSDTDNASLDTLTIRFTTIVLNDATVVRGDTFVNSAEVNYATGTPLSATSPVVQVVEPDMSIAKTVSTPLADAGEVVTFQIVVQHTSASNAIAYDVVIVDALPTGFTFAGGLAHMGGLSPTSLSESGGVITANYGTFLPGQTSVIEFQAIVNATVAGQINVNTAELTYTSRPGNVTVAQSPYNPLSVERTGDTADPGGAANTYSDDDSAAVRVRINSLAGTVYEDINFNGVQDIGEPGIANVTVTLTGTNANGSIAPISLLTDSDGNYLFDGLLAGNYTITETQPSGFVDGIEQGGDPGSPQGVTDDTTGADTISAIALSGGTNGTGYDFGEFRRDAIAGIVYVDANNNGIFDRGEQGINGVTMTLTGVDEFGNSVQQTTTTFFSGIYYFLDLRPGTYTVTEQSQTDPPLDAYLDARETFGNQAPIPGTVGTDFISGIVLRPNEIIFNLNFGELIPAEIRGVVFADLNSNSLIEAGDLPIPQTQLTLVGTNDLGQAIRQTTFTDNTGSYAFVRLRPGIYSVLETQPEGYLQGVNFVGSVGGTNPDPDTLADIGLGSGTLALEYNFLEVFVPVFPPINPNPPPFVPPFNPPSPSTNLLLRSLDELRNFETFVDLGASSLAILGSEQLAYLTGIVFHDRNHNGKMDVGEMGIPEAVVVLSGGPSDQVDRTDNTGTFRFDGLLPGEYGLRETPPGDCRFGVAVVGTDGGAADGIRRVSEIEVQPGSSGVGYLFAEVKPISISGTVFNDNDLDGTSSAGDTPSSDATIRIAGKTTLGEQVEKTVRTDARGNYAFADLWPGTYTLRQENGSGWLRGLAIGEDTDAPQDDTENPPQRYQYELEVLGGDVVENRNFVRQKSSEVSGQLFIDGNDNGVADAGEAMPAGTEVSLTGRAESGEEVTLQAQTDRDGRFRFENLSAGDYEVSSKTPNPNGDGLLEGSSSVKVSPGAKLDRCHVTLEPEVSEETVPVSKGADQSSFSPQGGWSTLSPISWAAGIVAIQWQVTELARQLAKAEQEQP